MLLLCSWALGEPQHLTETSGDQLELFIVRRYCQIIQLTPLTTSITYVSYARNYTFGMEPVQVQKPKVNYMDSWSKAIHHCYIITPPSAHT